MKEENFKEYLERIPEGVGMPLEAGEAENPVERGKKIISALDVLNAEGKIGLLPEIERTIEELKGLQNMDIRSENKEIRNTLMRLIAEGEKIEQTKN